MSGSVGSGEDGPCDPLGRCAGRDEVRDAPVQALPLDPEFLGLGARLGLLALLLRGEGFAVCFVGVQRRYIPLRGKTQP